MANRAWEAKLLELERVLESHRSPDLKASSAGRSHTQNPFDTPVPQQTAHSGNPYVSPPVQRSLALDQSASALSNSGERTRPTPTARSTSDVHDQLLSSNEQAVSGAVSIGPSLISPLRQITGSPGSHAHLGSSQSNVSQQSRVEVPVAAENVAADQSSNLTSSAQRLASPPASSSSAQTPLASDQGQTVNDANVDEAGSSLPAAVAHVLAQAVASALRNVSADSKKVQFQSRLLARLRQELTGRLPPDLEQQLGQALRDGADGAEGGQDGNQAQAQGPATPGPSRAQASASSPTSMSPSATLKLGPPAIELLQLSGWTGDASAEQVPAWPFGQSLVTAVALAHAGHPDRLCAQLVDVSRTARQLRLETQLLRSVVDQVRAEHGRRMAAVQAERDGLAQRVAQLEAQASHRSALPVRDMRGMRASALSVVASSPAASPPSVKVGFTTSPQEQPRGRRPTAIPKTPGVRRNNSKRPLSAGPRLGVVDPSAGSAPARGTSLPARGLHPPESASPPVALKRGTGLGAGGGKLLQATNTGQISAALLKAVRGRSLEGGQASRVQQAGPGRGRSMGRTIGHGAADATGPVPAPALKQRLSKSMGPVARPSAQPSARAAAAVDPAIAAAARIKQYRQKQQQTVVPVRGRPALRSTQPLGQTVVVNKGVGQALALSPPLPSFGASGSVRLPSPAGLSASDLQASPLHADLQQSWTIAVPAAATVRMSSQPGLPVSPPIPPGLKAVLDRINAAKRG